MAILPTTEKKTFGPSQLKNFLKTDYRILGTCLRQKMSITQEFIFGEYAWAYHTSLRLGNFKTTVLKTRDSKQNYLKIAQS